MKKISLFLKLLVVILFLSGCSNKHHSYTKLIPKKIKIGMSYNKVEKIVKELQIIGFSVKYTNEDNEQGISLVTNLYNQHNPDYPAISTIYIAFSNKKKVKRISFSHAFSRSERNDKEDIAFLYYQFLVKNNFKLDIRYTPLNKSSDLKFSPGMTTRIEFSKKNQNAMLYGNSKRAGIQIEDNTFVD